MFSILIHLKKLNTYSIAYGKHVVGQQVNTNALSLKHMLTILLWPRSICQHWSRQSSATNRAYQVCPLHYGVNGQRTIP